MSIRSGIAGQIGYGAETTWGTYTAPTRFLEVNSESIKNQIERIESQAIRASNRVLRSDRWVANPKGVAGSIDHEVTSKGFGLLFKHALGAVSIGTPTGATNTRDHTHTLGDPYGLGLTIQVGRPDTSGTVQPFSYLGCKVTEWTLSNEVDGILMLSLTVDGASETTGQALGTASYASSQELLTFVGGSVTIAGSEFALTSFELTGSNGLKTDRYMLRSSTDKKQPIIASPATLSGTMAGEFEGLTEYNRFVNGTTAAVVATWQGSTIESSFKYGVTVTLPCVRFDGETPELSGPDVLTQSLPFMALNDGSSEPVTVVYRTTDTAS